ncbi:uncharacterized protein LTR77_006541 [Saxophila tyrrhenica]|uniref:Uncharacterized protein n=1 Tax=Saxophila tyrrhenica TaxID=1690608 RepID=A0AAV9P5L2_9PEZI|nr:hypothetical protein LTR77_006541 [Saxophila tyrrhenica]
MYSMQNTALWATTLFALISASPTQVRHSSPNGMSKRGLGTLRSINCGLWATAITADAEQAIQDAAANVGTIAGVLTSNVGTSFVGPQSCSRLACVGTSGVYVCNHGDNGHWVQVDDLSGPGIGLIEKCTKFYNWGDVALYEQTPVSGQAFYVGTTLNLVVSYCDSNDDSSKKPSDYMFDDNCGPNGCTPTCGWDDAETYVCPV